MRQTTIVARHAGKNLTRDAMKKINGGKKIILCQPGFTPCMSSLGHWVCCCLNPGGCF